MKVICCLCSLRSRFASSGSIVSTTISTHDFQFWMGRHPRGGSLGCAVGKHVDDLTCLQVHHERSEIPPTPEREIINPDLGNFPDWLGGLRHDTSKDRRP